ncbi:hypothetical protein [Methanocalculus sp. MC3]
MIGEDCGEHGYEELLEMKGKYWELYESGMRIKEMDGIAEKGRLFKEWMRTYNVLLSESS